MINQQIKVRYFIHFNNDLLLVPEGLPATAKDLEAAKVATP